jgi:hypothetical protein
MQFPRLLYKSATEHVAVNDESERAERLASGWFDSVPEALAGKQRVTPVYTDVPESVSLSADEPEAAEVDPFDRDGDGKPGGSLPQSERDDPVTRPELEQKARELRIKFDGRTTDKSLAEKIDKAIR